MRFPPLSLALASLLSFSAAALAADKNPAYTDAAKAGPDFAIQGEYAGGDGENKWGAQVVALGEGKFDVVGFKGGLPVTAGSAATKPSAAMGS